MAKAKRAKKSKPGRNRLGQFTRGSAAARAAGRKGARKVKRKARRR